MKILDGYSGFIQFSWFFFICSDFADFNRKEFFRYTAISKRKLKSLILIFFTFQSQGITNDRWH